MLDVVVIAVAFLVVDVVFVTVVVTFSTDLAVESLEQSETCHL